MHDRTATLAIIAFFCLFFMAVSWFLPALFATYAPQQYFIEAHSFTATDASIDDRTHILCFDRTINDATTGTVFTELYLVNGERDDRIKLISRERERAFQEQRTTVRVEVEIPDGVEPGTYAYQRTYEIELAQGRVTRVFSFTSEEFALRQNRTALPETIC
jgi:hypothetical protein